MRPLLVVCACLGFAAAAGAQEVKLVPAAGQGWTTALAGSRATLEFAVKAAPGFRGALAWTLAEAANGRVLPGGRGESAVAAGGRAKLTLTFPAVNPGVVLKAKLAVALTDAGGKALATHDKVIHVFHPNPFEGRTKALEALKIAVYEPDPAGRTAAALKELQVPFEEKKTLAALAEGKAGVVVVAEGVSFKDEPGLADALLGLARRGVTVICLAPSAGTLPVPGADADRGEDLSLLRRDAITKLDDRLDAESWGGGQVVASTVSLKAVEGSVVAEVAAGPGGWPWLQVDYPRARGRLLVCGFAVVARWQASPTPRYLFAKVLEPAIPPE
jgi:hypothetical protein